MRANSIHAARIGVIISVAWVLAVGLGGCALLPGDPGSPTGVRLNRDGTIDWVSCLSVPKLSKVTGETYRRDKSGYVNDSTKFELSRLTPLPNTLAAGQIVQFSKLPSKWDDLYFTAFEKGTTKDEPGA